MDRLFHGVSFAPGKADEPSLCLANRVVMVSLSALPVIVLLLLI